MPRVRLTRFETWVYDEAGHVMGGYLRHHANEIRERVGAAEALHGHPNARAFLKSYHVRRVPYLRNAEVLDQQGKDRAHDVLEKIVGDQYGVQIPPEDQIHQWREDDCVVLEWED